MPCIVTAARPGARTKPHVAANESDLRAPQDGANSLRPSRRLDIYTMSVEVTAALSLIHSNEYLHWSIFTHTRSRVTVPSASDSEAKVSRHVTSALVIDRSLKAWLQYNMAGLLIETFGRSGSLMNSSRCYMPSRNGSP